MMENDREHQLVKEMILNNNAECKINWSLCKYKTRGTDKYKKDGMC